MSTWNKKNFSIYASDERSALGLIEELGNQTNYKTEEIEKVKESDNKKVSHDEMNRIYKIDKNFHPLLHEKKVHMHHYLFAYKAQLFPNRLVKP